MKDHEYWMTIFRLLCGHVRSVVYYQHATITSSSKWKWSAVLDHCWGCSPYCDLNVNCMKMLHGCFCSTDKDWCSESKSIWLVHSGTVISSICRQWKKRKISKKVISGCVEVLKMRIGKDCLGGWWEHEFKTQEDNVCRPVVYSIC